MAVGETVCPEFVDMEAGSSILIDASEPYICASYPKKKMKESIESGTFRKSYTTEFKLSVVEWVESHKSSVRAAAKQFGVDRKLVRVWLEHKPLLNSALVQHGPNRRKLHCGRPPASQELDRLALDFLCEQKRAGVQVKDRDLQQRALAIARDLGMESFKATSQWVRRWRQRCGVRLVNGVNEIANPTSSSTAMLTHVRPEEQVQLQTHAHQQAPPPEDENTGLGTVYVDHSSREHNYHRAFDRFEDDPALFCDVIESLDLPLGHEEVIEGEGHVTDCTPHACRTSLRCHAYKTLLSSDYTHCASCSPIASRISVPVYPAGPEIVYVDVPTLVSSAW
eukprot:Em0010g43a